MVKINNGLLKFLLLEASKTKIINDDLSNTSVVTSWARSELSYRKRLSQTSKVLAKTATPPKPLASPPHRPLHQVASAKLTPIPLTEKHGLLIPETKLALGQTDKYTDRKPMPTHASLAATAYKAAVNRVRANLSLPNEY